MSILKKIDGKDQVIANKSIIDHSQLSGTKAYGCHPISAIRQLPEKLADLKAKYKFFGELIEELEFKINNVDIEIDDKVLDLKKADEEFQLELERVESQAQQIKLVESTENKGQLDFTNFDGETVSVQGGFLPDYDTLTLNSENEMVLNKVYVDQDTLLGIGTQETPIELKNKPDEETIITDSENNLIYATSIKDDIGSVSPQSIRDFEEYVDEELNEINSDLVELYDNIRVINETDTKQDTSISLLNNKVNALQGVGGYLDATTFTTKDLSTPEGQKELTDYALQEIGITDPLEIWNGTRVKNEADNHLWVLVNTQDTDPKIFEWIDDGLDTVSTATNDSLGVVKGSTEDYYVSVNDITGVMSVNNLIEKFSEIDQTFEDVTNDITTIIDENITNINEQLDTINSDIDGINSDLETVNTELGKINQDIIDTNNKIDNINSGLNTNKLDKITTAGTERVYSINTDGTQSTKTISNTATQDTLPIYGTSGTLNVGTPTETTHATTKTYVDAAITNLQTQVDETITERLEPLEEITSILKTDGDGANYLSDDGTYKEVVTVTSDDQTIVTSEDKVLTAVGLYDSTTDRFKSANELFLGTTMILFEEGEVV